MHWQDQILPVQAMARPMIHAADGEQYRPQLLARFSTPPYNHPPQAGIAQLVEQRICNP